MRFHLLAAAATFMLATSFSSHADTLAINATLQDGGTITGTAFAGPNSDITVDLNGTSYLFTGPAVGQSEYHGITYINLSDGVGDDVYLAEQDLSLSAPTFDGPGILCSLTAPCSFAGYVNDLTSTFYTPNQTFSVISGTVDYATVTPEPSGLVLFGTGMLIVAGVMRKRFINA